MRERRGCWWQSGHVKMAHACEVSGLGVMTGGCTCQWSHGAAERIAEDEGCSSCMTAETIELEAAERYASIRLHRENFRPEGLGRLPWVDGGDERHARLQQCDTLCRRDFRHDSAIVGSFWRTLPSEVGNGGSDCAYWEIP